MEPAILTALLPIITGEHISQAAVNNHKNISVSSCTVADLFTGLIPETDISGQLTIPHYQRPYVWKQKEVLGLLTDLRDYFNTADSNAPMYYLGSVIIHQEGNKLNVIDGQQRLTTLAVIQSCVGNSKAPAIGYAHPITIQNIKHNHQLLKQQIAEIGGFNEFNAVQINVTLIVTNNEDDAYTFFETQNTGGVRLTGVDIIKAHHLRAIEAKKEQGYYATLWENQKAVHTVVNYLIKARKWGFLNWHDLPSHRNLKANKELIIDEFSKKTKLQKNRAFKLVSFDQSNDGVALNISSLNYAIRQPLGNGQNFIEYLECFTSLHERLFIRKADKDISDEFYKFQQAIINHVDGTIYLKELYETAILCYVQQFGVSKLIEAAYWIFRYAYSIRISNEKTVREISIQAFLRNNNYLLDHILSCFTHEQLVARLKQFKYDVDNQNCEPDKAVKGRFVHRVEKYFTFTATKKNENDKWIITDYDILLKKVIHDRINNAQ